MPGFHWMDSGYNGTLVFQLAGLNFKEHQILLIFQRFGFDLLLALYSYTQGGNESSEKRVKYFEINLKRLTFR